VSKTQSPTFDRLAVPYDRGMAILEALWLRKMRARLLSYASGRMLEIGVGTGANMPFLDPSLCITAIDESPEMLAVAARRAASLGRCVQLSRADVEHLAFPTGSFDTVVTSLVLCSVVNSQQAIRELRRVLRKPGGRLLLMEHMRPHVPWLGRLVDLADVPWYAFNGRCHLNRDTQQAIARAGFEIERVETRLGGFFRLLIARTT
jgi:ubiquinone/menaquinone biosynthesis C-methylase UbiE